MSTKSKSSYAKAAFCLMLVCTLLCSFTSCGKQYRDDRDADQVASAILSAVSAAGRHAVGEDFISASAFGEEYTALLNQTDSHIIYIADASDTNIDEFGVFHVTQSGDIKQVKQILDEYVKAQKLRLSGLLESYNPGELPKLDNAGVTVCGHYVLYFILSDLDATAARNAFEDALTAE